MNARLFFLIFGLITSALFAAIGVPWWVIERKRRSKIRERLDVLTDEPALELHAVTILQEDRGTAWHVQMRTWAMSQVDAAGLKWSSSKVLAVCALCALAGGLSGMRLSHALPHRAAAFTPVLPALFAGLPFLYLARKRQARLTKIESQLPDALDFLARSLRIGNSFLMSLEMLVEESEEPLRGEFRKLTSEIRLGSPMAEPMQKLMLRVPLIDLKMFVSAVLLQRETGGNLGALLTRIAASIRDRFRVRGQVEAAASQAKLSARVLSAMPFVVLGGILLFSPDYLKIMTDEPLGRKLLVIAGFGQVAGFVIMHKIVKIKV